MERYEPKQKARKSANFVFNVDQILPFGVEELGNFAFESAMLYVIIHPEAVSKSQNVFNMIIYYEQINDEII